MLDISADPAEQLGAENSISPKNDLLSFCTSVAMRKICEFKIAQKMEIIENHTKNRECQHKKSHRKKLDNRNKNRIRSLSEVSHRIAVQQSLQISQNLFDAMRLPSLQYTNFPVLIPSLSNSFSPRTFCVIINFFWS